MRNSIPAIALSSLLIITGLTTGCTKTSPDIYTEIANQGIRLPIHLRVNTGDKHFSIENVEDLRLIFNTEDSTDGFTVWIHGEKQLKMWLEEFGHGGIATTICGEVFKDTPRGSEHIMYVLRLIPRPSNNNK